MKIEIHVYHHILTGADTIAALEAEILALKAKALTPADLANVDDMTARAKGLAADAPDAGPAPTPTTP
jgi:hypothetical protein